MSAVGLSLDLSNVSQEQLQIIQSDFEHILLVKAYAGTGKSFTLKKFCIARQGKGSRFCYFVYNKSMRVDAQGSFSGIEGVYITTFHSLAWSVIGKNFQERLENEGLKSLDLISFFDSNEVDEENLYIYANGLFSLLSDFAASSYTMEEFLQTMRAKKREWSVNNGVPLLFLLKMLPSVWDEIVNNSSLPFNHDYYLKLYQLSKPTLDFDYILVDEAQDISPVMIDIVLSQKCKLVFVGDSFQSIYSWRGAVDSLEFLEKTRNPDVFYLSQSFRCPPKIGFLANRIIRIAGAQKEFRGVAKINDQEIETRKTYIARTNGGLFKFCAENLDKKIYFVGGVKGYNLSDLLDIKNVQTQKKEYISNSFFMRFNSFKELVDYAHKVNDVGIKGLIGLLFKFSEENIFELIKNIKQCAVKKEEEADFIITTAHKSKGLEWGHVELLEDFPFMSSKKMKNINLGEELRLLYVATTRAKTSIHIPDEILEYIEEND